MSYVHLWPRLHSQKDSTVFWDFSWNLDLSILAFYYVGAEEGLYSFYGQDKIASANAVLHMLYLFFSYATIGGHQGDGEIQILTNTFSISVQPVQVQKLSKKCHQNLTKNLS